METVEINLKQCGKKIIKKVPESLYSGHPALFLAKKEKTEIKTLNLLYYLLMAPDVFLDNPIKISFRLLQ